MGNAGISQADLAKRLQVSRAAVSKWFQEESAPRPDKLLKIALILNLPFEQIVLRAGEDEPVVAYRKKGSRKTNEAHIAKATAMGHLLRPLVKYLPFDDLVRPPTLKNPEVDYEFIQRAAGRTREELGLGPGDVLDFQHLIHKFAELQAVLIPVLWGSVKNHGNALHIHLPDSMTTWVYLNLDAHIHDFKFWMAHELGHILSPELRGEIAEDFADAFAGALLFPREQAEVFWIEEREEPRPAESQLWRIRELAETSVVSPVTIYHAINEFAKSQGETPIDLAPDIYKSMNAVRTDYPTVSQVLFKSDAPEPARYLHLAETLFESPFFDALRKYLRDEDKGSGYLQSILDIPILDAQALVRELK